MYQFEVASKAKVPNDWIEVSKTQSVSRWYNEKLRSIIKKLLEAKEHCEAGMRDIKARLYEKFDEHFHEWYMRVYPLTLLLGTKSLLIWPRLIV